MYAADYLYCEVINLCIAAVMSLFIRVMRESLTPGNLVWKVVYKKWWTGRSKYVLFLSANFALLISA